MKVHALVTEWGMSVQNIQLFTDLEKARYHMWNIVVQEFDSIQDMDEQWEKGSPDLWVVIWEDIEIDGVDKMEDIGNEEPAETIYSKEKKYQIELTKLGTYEKYKKDIVEELTKKNRDLWEFVDDDTSTIKIQLDDKLVEIKHHLSGSGGRSDYHLYIDENHLYNGAYEPLEELVKYLLGRDEL